MSDHDFFNCSQKHEHDYVARQYPVEERDRVREFLKECCKNGKIFYSTHKEVYDLIRKELGLTRE